MIETPTVTLEEDGIIFVDFRSLLVTLDLLYDGLNQQRALAPKKKSKVLLVGQAATKVDTDMIEFGACAETVQLTAAVAIVPLSKIGWILANLFMPLQRNPYPTRAFDTIEEGREWLLSLDAG
ncbi:MAG: hypothetical protein ISR50_19745 [Alphaproteobacteria bacterium]|nr:hypothetical protein [Alphaproteobacteria bacterium]